MRNCRLFSMDASVTSTIENEMTGKATSRARGRIAGSPILFVKYQTDQRAVNVHPVVLDETYLPSVLTYRSTFGFCLSGRFCKCWNGFRRRSLQSKAYPASFLMLLRRWSDICAGELSAMTYDCRNRLTRHRHWHGVWCWLFLARPTILRFLPGTHFPLSRQRI